MLNSARTGLSYAAMLVMLAARVAAADNPPASGTRDDAGPGNAGWQKGHRKRVQSNMRHSKHTPAQ